MNSYSRVSTVFFIPFLLKVGGFVPLVPLRVAAPVSYNLRSAGDCLMKVHQLFLILIVVLAVIDFFVLQLSGFELERKLEINNFSAQLNSVDIKFNLSKQN